MASTIHILMKTECLVADVTLGASPYRAEHYILGMILGAFWPIHAVFVVGEQLCDVGIRS